MLLGNSVLSSTVHTLRIQKTGNSKCHKIYARYSALFSNAYCYVVSNSEIFLTLSEMKQNYTYHIYSVTGFAMWPVYHIYTLGTTLEIIPKL